MSSITTPSEAEKQALQASNGSTAAQKPPRDITGWKWFAVVLSILSSTFLFALDNTITANIQADIVREFDAVSKLTWISVGLVMSAAATVLLWGKIFYQFNTKWSYIISVAIFEVGSSLCGAAPNMDTLIVGRVLCGVGGSGTGLTWGLGTVLGPIIGGGFSQSSVGWRWAFYINLVVGGACAPVYLFLIPNIDPRRGAGLMDRAREIDYVGGVLNIGAFVSGVMAISFGGVTWAWGSARIIALFVVSGILFILLGIQQALPLFTTVSRRLVVFTRGDDAFDSGVRLLPFIVLCIFAIIANGALMSKFGFYMPWYAFGGALVLIGGALFYTVDIDTSVARIYGYSILTGLGSGVYLQAAFSIAQASNPRERIADAPSFITCSQVVGSTIALAIANSVFLNKAQREVSRILPEISLRQVQTVISGTGDILARLSDSTRREVEVGIVESMGDTYILVITAGALTLVLSFLMKHERLFK
ncbi:major facilitator superfamily domain-containing protein [Aspergillus stella-maris]|uniref:major facilitator superfamily domain-containing protein n=1 Tax=Aspergillus stella-maris TaxID=1810926 RepID=UPI003CCD7B31